ncbi:sarcoplasmic reticulum histidine-rich calcium-binding protein isoform X1 [Hydra vulgaris]|uniref:sarcoplasmic reticulum histidine-rich calcium-binding protein isoform X1 n=2 Tax=Hydra vulgaris TaxID=6087 RepID=UPI000640FBAA|nr:sarcoplasmic reticulum histidine-rich calcium-binding protein isoform X1 [Hydra vulgaris]
MAKEIHIILLLLLVKTNTYLADDSNLSNNKLNKEDDDPNIHLATEDKLKIVSNLLKCADCHDQKKDLIRSHYDENNSQDQDQTHSEAELSSNHNYDLRNLRSSYKELKRRHNITSNATNRQMMIKPFSGSIVGDIKHKWRDEDKEEEGKKVKSDDEEKSTHSKGKKSKKEKDEAEEKDDNEEKTEHSEHKDVHEEHEEEHRSFHKPDDDAESFHKSHDDSEPFHKSHENHEPFHKSHDDHEPFHNSHEDHELFHKSHEDHEPFHKSHEDHESFHKSHEDPESFHKSHDYPEPFHKSHEDHEHFHKSHEDYEPYHKSHEDDEHFHKSHDEQFPNSNEGHESFHKSHEPIHHNGHEVNKKDEDEEILHDMDKDRNFDDGNIVHEKLKEEDKKLEEEDKEEFNDHGGGFEEDDEDDEFGKDHYDDLHQQDLDKDMDFPREDDEYRRHHKRNHDNLKNHHNEYENHNLPHFNENHNVPHFNENHNLPHFNENVKNLLAPKDVNYLNHGTEPLFSSPNNEEKVSMEGINRDMEYNNRFEGDNQNIYNPIQSFVEKSHKAHEVDNDYLNNPGESIGRRIEREEAISGQFTRKYDVQKSKVESAKKDPYSSIEDLKVDDDEGPDDAPSKNKKHSPGELAWNKDMPYKDLKNKNQAHRRHHFHEFSEFSRFPKFGELGRGRNKKHHNRHKGNEREKISNHPDEYDSHGHIKGEIRNYDDEYDSPDEEENHSHKKESHYKAIEHPHDGIEKFGKDDEEVIINDRTHQGDINEVEIVKQLTDPKAALTHGVRSHRQSFDKSNIGALHEPKEYGVKTSHGLLGNSEKDGGGEFYENNPNVYPHEFNSFNRPYSNQNIQIGQYGKRRIVKYDPFDTIVGGGFNGETTFKSFDQAEDIFKKMRNVVKETSLAPNEIKEHGDHFTKAKRTSIGIQKYGKRNTLKKIESRLKKIQEKIFSKSAFQKQMKKSQS